MKLHSRHGDNEMDDRKLQVKVKEMVVTLKETTKYYGREVDIACIKAAAEVIKAQVIAEQMNEIKQNLHRIG